MWWNILIQSKFPIRPRTMQRLTQNTLTHPRAGRNFMLKHSFIPLLWSLMILFFTCHGEPRWTEQGETASCCCSYLPPPPPLYQPSFTVPPPLPVQTRNRMPDAERETHHLRKDISYVYFTMNMMIWLDRNANAASEAFISCCAPLMDANCVWVCVYVE